MFGSKHGSGQSMDCAAQSMDLCFEQQSMDCLLNPRITQTEGSKAWIWVIHGLTWTKCGITIAVATTEWKVHGFHEKSVAILTRKVDLSVIENDDRKFLQTFITKPCSDTFLKTALGISLHFL